MKRPTDNDSLLDDVLAEAAPPEFRDQLLQTTLRQARRRRQFRRGRLFVLGVAAVSLLGVWVVQQGSRLRTPPVMLVGQPEFPLNIVHTRPLAAAALISTLPAADDMFVATRPGQYCVIGDDELLALAAPAPVALIRCGPDCAQLVFANPADRERLLMP